MKLFWLALFGLAPCLAAAAPLVLPTQDVAVTYNLVVPNHADATYLMQYNAASRLARLNNTVENNYDLLNLNTGSAELVVPQMNSVVAIPDLSNLTKYLTNTATTRFTPLGRANYAGLACQTYLVHANQGSGTACLTNDGVILYFSGSDPHGAATITATSVTYSPQPAAEFAVPQGMTTINVPQNVLNQLLGQ